MTVSGRFPRIKLFYFEKDTDRKHINFIVLGANTKVRADPVVPKNQPSNTGFSIECEGGRVYHLAADSEDEQIQWVVVLKKICLVLSQREQQNHHMVATDSLLIGKGSESSDEEQKQQQQQQQQQQNQQQQQQQTAVLPKQGSKAARLLAAESDKVHC